MGGNNGPRTRTSVLPISVLKRGPIFYYSINFNQHKNFYNFLSSDVVDIFLNSVSELYHPTKENKIQGYTEIINQQRDEIILEDKRVWLTNFFQFKTFYRFC